MKSACEHIPENSFKHPIVIQSSNLYNRTCKFLNYLIHEKNILETGHVRHTVARAMLASVSHTFIRGLKGNLFSKKW